MSEALSPAGADYQHFRAPSQRRIDRFQSRHRLNPYVESEPTLQGLPLEVDQIKKRGEQGMYLLPDTGFQVKTQVDLLLDNRTKGIRLSDSLDQLDQDIQGFKTEYLVELPVFPILLERKIKDGREQLVGKLYGGKSLSEATSGDERDGVVKKSIQKVEDALLSSKPGTLIVMASPGGWSGYQSKDNRLEPLNKADILSGKAKEITYPDSQTYCFEVLEGGEIRGFTLKTDMTLAQNKELLKRLGASAQAFETPKDEITDIKQVVDTVLVIDPENKKKIEDIAKTIQHIKGSEIAYRDSKKDERRFSEMMELLQNPEGLWNLDEKTRDLTAALRDFIAERFKNADTDLRTDLETALGLTVLKLMHEVRPRRQARQMRHGKSYLIQRNVLNAPFDPQAQLEELQKIAGCAGGGKKKKNILNSLTPRIGLEKDDEEQEWFNCPKCGYQADGPIGNTCPGCNLTKDEYAAEEGAIVCD